MEQFLIELLLKIDWTNILASLIVGKAFDWLVSNYDQIVPGIEFFWSKGWSTHDATVNELVRLLKLDSEALEQAWNRHDVCIQGCADILKRNRWKAKFAV